MVKRILAASAWLTVGSFCLVQNAIASESFSCNLTKFMEVANDGSFFGPETIEEFLTLELRDEKVFVIEWASIFVTFMISLAISRSLQLKVVSLRWKPFMSGGG